VNVGFELHALESARQTLARTAVLHCEVLFVPIYASQPLFSHLQIFLAEQNYYFVDLVNPVRLPMNIRSGRSYPDTLIFADAIFLRNPAPSDVELHIVQARLTVFVYGTRRFAEGLLQRCDERNRTQRASIFLT